MPIAPGVLPAPLRTRRSRVSSLLFHLRARDLSLVPVTGQVPTFSRASAGGMVWDRNNRGSFPVHSQPRWESVDTNGDGVGDEVGLLIELARTNKCIRSQEFDTWTSIGTTSVTANAKVAPDGTLTGDLITCTHVGPASAGRSRSYLMSADGVASCVGYLSVGDGSPTLVMLHDSTATTNRHLVRVTWTNGVPSLATISGGGTLFPVVPVAGGWYRIAFNATGVISANTNVVRVYTNNVSSGVNGNSVYVWGFQVEEAAYPTSYVPTAAATVSRATDRLTYPWNFEAFTPATDDLTLYSRFARPNHADAVGDILDYPGIMSLGGSGASVIVYFSAGGRQLNVEVADGLGATVTRAAAIPAGAVIEVLAQLKDLAVAPAAAIDVGAGLGSFLTNSLAAISTFGTPLVGIGEIQNGTNKLGAPIMDVKVASGLLSLDQMREAF